MLEINFKEKVDSINKGEINSELIIDIGNGDKVASIITSNSIDNLKIKIKIWVHNKSL